MDLTGPCEVFGNSSLALDLSRRKIDIASATETTTASEGVTVQRDVALDADISEYDVLLVPGALPKNVHKALQQDEHLVTLVRTFATRDRPGDKQRWLLSVCTGAGFLGAAGLLDGRTVTTHFRYIDTLQAACAKAKVVRRRLCYAGELDGGVRMVTAGGVSCGVDAALWMVGEIWGRQAALGVAESMDYWWAEGGNAVTEGVEVV